MNTTTTRKIALGLGALAIVGMGSITVACSPRTEKPAEPSVSNSSPAPTAEPTEKNLQTNVTRAPLSAGPAGGGGGGNAAVPCGFGPQGGARCGGR